MSYRRFSLLQGGIFKLYLSEGVDQTAPDLGRTDRVPSSLHEIGYFGIDALLRFEMRAAERRVVSKIEAKFHTFWLPVKFRGGV